MNALGINRSILPMHIAAIEQKYPIKILGLLPRGAAAHILSDRGLDFLAHKKDGLSLLDLCKAEIELGEKLGRPVGIVLRSGLTGREVEEIPALVEPI